MSPKHTSKDSELILCRYGQVSERNNNKKAYELITKHKNKVESHKMVIRSSKLCITMAKNKYTKHDTHDCRAPSRFFFIHLHSSLCTFVCIWGINMVYQFIKDIRMKMVWCAFFRFTYIHIMVFINTFQNKYFCLQFNISFSLAFLRFCARLKCFT